MSTKYVTIGEAGNVAYISAMQKLKDGTRITRLFKVSHEDMNDHHSHGFEAQAVDIAYGGRKYEGAIRNGNVRKFTLDGKDIETSLNRELMDMIGHRRGTSCIEGMTKLMCKAEGIPHTNGAGQTVML